MHKAFIASFAANVILSLVAPALLPPRVAIHFGLGGRPDNWAPGYVHALVFLGLDVVLFALVFFSTRLALACPPQWLNLPNKAFWLAPENRPSFRTRIATLMHHFGTALFLFFLAMEGLAIQANRAQPVRLDERAAVVCVAMFLAYAAGWSIVFFRSFRIPREPAEEDPHGR